MWWLLKMENVSLKFMEVVEETKTGFYFSLYIDFDLKIQMRKHHGKTLS